MILHWSAQQILCLNFFNDLELEYTILYTILYRRTLKIPNKNKAEKRQTKLDKILIISFETVLIRSIGTLPTE